MYVSCATLAFLLDAEARGVDVDGDAVAAVLLLLLPVLQVTNTTKYVIHCLLIPNLDGRLRG